MMVVLPDVVDGNYQVNTHICRFEAWHDMVSTKFTNEMMRYEMSGMIDWLWYNMNVCYTKHACIARGEQRLGTERWCFSLLAFASFILLASIPTLRCLNWGIFSFLRGSVGYQALGIFLFISMEVAWEIVSWISGWMGVGWMGEDVMIRFQSSFSEQAWMMNHKPISIPKAFHLLSCAGPLKSIRVR